MVVRELCEGISAAGIIDWNREVFDALIPLPDGTTYNSYIVRGSEKTALIDTVDGAFEEELITNLARSGIGSLDYIVVNHAEQDHSGSLPMVLELFPMAKVLATEKCRDLLTSLLGVPASRVRIVEDGEEVSLGDRTLRFLHMGWVHWPETMVTYAVEDEILFSCDLFGSHYAASDLFAGDPSVLYTPAKRYYAEIMMPFRAQIKKHLERLSGIPIRMIAPSHGPVHKDPRWIMDLYASWVSDDVENLVVIPYVSMHGSTEEMVLWLADALIMRGIRVRPYDVSRADIGKVAADLVDAATIVIGAPTVLFGPHPAAAHVAFLANILKPKARWLSIIGSYGWGGKTVQDLSAIVHKLPAEVLEPVYIKGAADENARRDLVRLADDILKRHQELHLV